MPRRFKDDHVYRRDHPGLQILDRIAYFKLTRRELAEHIGMDRIYLDEVIRGAKPVGHKLAALLSQALRTTVHFWVFSQADYNYGKWEKLAKAKGEFPTVPALSLPRQVNLPGPLDRCVCEHWGWEHIDGPEGACIALKDDGTECGCGMYMRLGGYLAALEALNAHQKDRTDEERSSSGSEQQRDDDVSEL